MPALRARAVALGFGLVVLCGIFFRIYHADRKTFWEDESLGAMHALGYTEADIVRASPRIGSAGAMQAYLELPAGDSLAATVRSLASEDPQHPPLFYVLEHLWVRAFGASVASLRALPVLCGILVLPCAFWLARELFGKSAAAPTFTALLALSPFFVLYAQEAREYSLWTIATLVMSVTFLRAKRAPSFANWTIYAAALALSLYIFPLSALVALGCGFALALERGRSSRAAVAGYLAASLAAALAFAPWAAAMLAESGLRRGMEGIASARLSPLGVGFVFLRNVRSAFFDFGTFRAGTFGSSLPNAALLAIASLLAAYALVCFARRAPREAVAFVFGALCLPFAILVLADLSGHGRFVYQTRYFTPLLLGVQLAVAFLFTEQLASGVKPWLWRSAFACLLLAEAASCVAGARANTWWNKDYERSPEVAAIVNATPGALVASDDFTPGILSLSRYLRPGVALRLRLKCAQCALPESPAGEPFIASLAPDARGAPDGAGSVFVLGVPDVSNRSYRWIDARPYPPRRDPLDMFEAI